MKQVSLDSAPIPLRTRVVLAVCGALALAGCLVTSDFDGIVGVRPGGSAEAGSSSGTPPGSSSGNGTDGSTLPDGGTPIGGLCDGEHLLCSHFDSTAALPVPGWGKSESAGGTVRLDATLGASAPNALLASVPVGASNPAAVLLRTVGLGSFAKLTFAFDFRPVQCPTQVTHSITMLFLRLAPDYGVGFVMLSSGTYAVGTHGTNGDTFYPLDQPVPAGQWSHITIEITPGTALGIRTLVGTQVAMNRNDAHLEAFDSNLTINLGQQGVSTPQGCSVAYDNVVADKE